MSDSLQVAGSCQIGPILLVQMSALKMALFLLPCWTSVVLLLTLSHGVAAKVCNNGGMGREAAMLKLLGRYDDATLDYAARVRMNELHGFAQETPFVQMKSGGIRKLLGGKEKEDSLESRSGDFLQPFSLHDVRLVEGSHFERAQQTNLEYLLYLDIDRLVWR
jgi:hypothetical protein